MRELQTLFDTGPKVCDSRSPSAGMTRANRGLVRQEHRLEYIDIHDARRRHDLQTVPDPGPRVDHPQRLLSRGELT